jgi:hypothetical protein
MEIVFIILYGIIIIIYKNIRNSIKRYIMADSNFGLSLWNEYDPETKKRTIPYPKGDQEPALFDETRTGWVFDEATNFQGTGIHYPFIEEASNEHKPREPLQINGGMLLNIPQINPRQEEILLEKHTTYSQPQPTFSLPTNTAMNQFNNTFSDGVQVNGLVYDFFHNKYLDEKTLSYLDLEQKVFQDVMNNIEIVADQQQPVENKIANDEISNLSLYVSSEDAEIDEPKEEEEKDIEEPKEEEEKDIEEPKEEEEKDIEEPKEEEEKDIEEPKKEEEKDIKYDSTIITTTSMKDLLKIYKEPVNKKYLSSEENVDLIQSTSDLSKFLNNNDNIKDLTLEEIQYFRDIFNRDYEPIKGATKEERIYRIERARIYGLTYLYEISKIIKEKPPVDIIDDLNATQTIVDMDKVLKRAGKFKVEEIRKTGIEPTTFVPKA